jgi:trans-aconitate methyltransferase
MVHSVDFNIELIKATVGLFGVDNKVTINQSLDAVPIGIDFVFAWHVLEHVPDPILVLEDIYKIMNSGGCLAIQVPKLRSEYVIDCHFILFNRYSAEYALKMSGFKVVAILNDFDSHFLTMLAKK